MTSRIAIATALAAGLGVGTPAAAQSTGSEAAQLRAEIDSLRSRLDDLEARQEGEGSVVAERSDRGVRLTVAGRVNQALLYAEQGDQDQAFVIDNDASGSRFELLAETTLGDLTTGVEIVVSAEVNSTDAIDFSSNQEAADEDSDLGDFRQAHWFVEGERFGYLSIGQGDTAAEDTAHADLSGTDFAGSGSDVDDIAGGLQFSSGDVTTADGSLLEDDDDDELDDFFDMQDGSRALRLLYVTPEFNGFALKASLQNDEESLEGRDGDGDEGGLTVAIGAQYEGELANGIEIAAEASWRQDQVTEIAEDGSEEEIDERFVVGSASILLPSGLNFTVAGSRGDVDGAQDDPTAAFAKIGYITDRFTSLGETRFSLDYFRGRNNDAFAAPDGDLPTAQSIGLFAVQELRDLNTELYVGARRYEVDDVFVDGSEVDVDDLTAVLAGARVRF
jgi:predicted porin